MPYVRMFLNICLGYFCTLFGVLPTYLIEQIQNVTFLLQIIVQLELFSGHVTLPSPFSE